MSEDKSELEREFPTGGVSLLFIGVVLNTLWRFWPVILIITGVGVLLKHLNVWLVSIVLLVILFGCLWMAMLQADIPLPWAQINVSFPHSGMLVL
jgi:Na+-translocating ferredoxin:NAD+ oxidoreductase RnfD subunit